MLADRMRMTARKSSGKVISLLHFNGTNGSNIVGDDTGKVWYVAGTPISTTRIKFGAAAALFNSSNFITTYDVTDFDWNKPFTMDFWIFAGISGMGLVGGQQSNSLSTPVLQMFLSSAKLNVRIYCGTTMYQLVSNAYAGSTWTHFAIVRTPDNIIKLYKDGVVQAQIDMTGLTINVETSAFRLGRINDEYNGTIVLYLDEFRFVKGKAMWLTDFTPPMTEYTL